MSFFEPKEEVLNIELTPYGRELLSKGKFKPVYYTFHDDEVLYDLEYFNKTEDQNEIKSRILYEGVHLKPNKRFNTASYDYSILNNTNLLSNAEQQSQYKPAWNSTLLKSNIDSVEQSGSNKLVKINCSDIVTNYSLIELNQLSRGFNIVSDASGSKAFIANINYFLLDLSELNVEQDDTNFETYLYLSSSSDGLKQLNFKKEKNYVVNDILLSEEDLKTDDLEYSDDLAETYFIVEVDEEISEIRTVSTETETYRIRNDGVSGEEC